MRDLFAAHRAVPQNVFGPGKMSFSLYATRVTADLRRNKLARFSQFCSRTYTVIVVEDVEWATSERSGKWK
jgi:hypothetical protein